MSTRTWSRPARNGKGNFTTMALVAFQVRAIFLPFLIHPYIHIAANKTQSMVPAICTQKTACSGLSSKMGTVISHPWDNAGANSVTWPLNFSNENTTPSLTSDNDHERDDISHDEHTPPTPPGAHSHVLHRIREPKQVPEVNAYIECHDVSNLQGSQSPKATSSQPSSMADIFARRPPTSPLPPDKPRKPYRPSKARRSPRLSMSVNDIPCLTNATPMGTRDSSNPLPPQEPVGQPPKRDLRESFRPFAQNAKGRRSRKQTRLYPSSSAQHIFRSHRRTLVEELRHAGQSLQSIGAEDLLDYEECDAFIGVGSREKSCDTTFYMKDNAMHTENKVK